MRKLIHNEKGSALLISLLLMGMLTLLAIMAVRTSNTDMDLTFNQINSDKSFYIAEAGAKRAFVELNNNNYWRTGYSDVVFNQGVFTVSLIDSSIEAALDDTVIVHATGSIESAVSRVDLWTVPEYLYPFRFALFGESGIALDRNTCTDSYNSDSGSYAATVLTEQGSLGTNGTITTSKDVNIGGDAFTAVGGSITLGVNSHILGDTSTARDSVELDIIPQTEYDWAEAHSRAPSGFLGGGYTYDNGDKSLTLGSYTTLTLNSGVYYFSSITVGQYSNIQLAAGANVTIYLTGDFHLMQSSTVNSGGYPINFQVYSQGSTLQFDQGNTFVGTFYGPNAHIQYDQTTQVFGSLVGGSVKLDQGACMHYDRNLNKAVKKMTGKMMAIAWQEL